MLWHQVFFILPEFQARIFNEIQEFQTVIQNQMLKHKLDFLNLILGVIEYSVIVK